MRRTKPIPKKLLRVKRSKSGLGLFADDTIAPGMYIEYTGTLISTKKANTMHGARYLFEINKVWTINGSSRNNLARYINHSCTPNCESVLDGTHVYIKTLQELHQSEELVYDYGEEYFEEFIQPNGCNCAKCFQRK
ncbi:MAG: SET domain-containing protein [Parcubacteria group bacterium GW2011_GWA2_43_11]|nr:MAG: SET domain-containing protein [Parcubacteria group bacterium GW2011_GWC2_42_11]KKS85301.1 MAG: SET domain-containing protein [Parcubacteria group bacterium GW2011_GWA2_43_11]